MNKYKPRAYYRNFTICFQRIAGADSGLQQTFTNALGATTPYTEMKVKEAIHALNNKREERLILLLEYIEDQGKFIDKWNFINLCIRNRLILLWLNQALEFSDCHKLSFV